MAIVVTPIYSSTDLFIANFYFAVNADVAGAIPHGMIGVGATALADTTGVVSVSLSPILLAGAVFYYLEQLAIASVTATVINISRTINPAGGPAASNNARVELRRVHHLHR